eukprot:gene2282-5276_t
MWSIKVLQHETQRVRCLGKANGDKGTEQRTSQFYFSSIDFCLFSRSMFAPSLAHKQERSSMLALLGYELVALSTNETVLCKPGSL